MTLKDKIKKAHQVIKKAAKRWEPKEIAVAWTGGKDSTVLLHLIKETFHPLRGGRMDSSEVKRIMGNKAEEPAGLKRSEATGKPRRLNEKEIKKREEAMEIMRIAKINAINYALEKYDIKAFISGIRWDEHEARSREKYFSPRSTHTRVHPTLHFTLADIWAYIKQFNVPYVSLYDKGYKSLGEAPLTKPIKDKNAPERAGREATKEKTMERLRQLGYW